MNRIATAIDDQNKNIKDRLANGLTTRKALNELYENLDMELDEYCRFQDLKSLAVADETLSLDEGQTIYQYLGNTPEVFNKQVLAVKTVLTEVFRSLMQKAVAAK